MDSLKLCNAISIMHKARQTETHGVVVMTRNDAMFIAEQISQAHDEAVKIGNRPAQPEARTQHKTDRIHDCQAEDIRVLNEKVFAMNQLHYGLRKDVAALRNQPEAVSKPQFGEFATAVNGNYKALADDVRAISGVVQSIVQEINKMNSGRQALASVLRKAKKK